MTSQQCHPAHSLTLHPNIFTPHLARALGLGGLQRIRHRVKVHHLDLQGKEKKHAKKMEMVPQKPFPLEKMVWLRSRSAA